MAAKSQSKNGSRKGKVNRTHKAKRQSSWQDELGIGYATYDHESDYVSPATTQNLSDEQLNNIEKFNQRLARTPVFADNIKNIIGGFTHVKSLPYLYDLLVIIIGAIM